MRGHDDEPSKPKCRNARPTIREQPTRADSAPLRAVSAPGTGAARRSPAGVVAAVLALASCVRLLWGQATEPEVQPIAHGAPINCAVYTPDGRYVATAGSDQLIKLWDAKSGEEVRTLAGHTAQVLGLAVSPDGSAIASAAADNTLRVWDVPLTEPLRKFQGHAAAVRAVAVSPDGKWAVTVAADNSARVWDLTEGKAAAVLSEPAAPPASGAASAVEGDGGGAGQVQGTAVAVRADNNQVAAGDSAGEIRLWHPLEGTPQGTIGAHFGRVTGLFFHSNNQQLISAGADGTWKLWQLPVALPKLLAGPAAPVRAAAVTSNGQLAVIGGDDGVWAFALPGGQVARELTGAVGATHAVAISPNTAVAAAGGDAGVIKLWNLGDGADRLTLAGHDGVVHALAFHPDNARLASAGADGTVRLWRLPVPAVNLAGHTGDVAALAVSSGGQFAATVSADKTVRLWNPANGQALRQLAGSQQPLTRVAIRADNAQLAAGDAAGEIRFWNPGDGADQGTLGAHTGAVRGMAYHPASEQLVTVGDDGCTKVWRLPLLPAQPLGGHGDVVAAVAITADGKTAVTGGSDKTVRVYDTASGQQVRQFEGVPEAVTALALGAGDAVTAAGAANGVIKLWNTADGTAWRGPPDQAADAGAPAASAELFGHDGPVADLSFDARSQRLISAGADGTVRVWLLPHPPVLLPNPTGPAAAMVVSPDGKRLAVTATVQERPGVLIRELDGGKTVATLLGHTAAVSAMAFSRDGSTLASTGGDNTVRVWNLADGKFPEVQRLTLPAAVTSVALNDNGTQVLTVSADNVIRAWSVAEGSEVRAFPGHGGAVSSLHVAGRTLISGSADGTVRLWNLETGADVRTLNHAAAVTAVTADDGGKVIASAGADKLVKLWNAADGAPIAALAGHEAAAVALRFNAEGTRLASAVGGSLWLWDVSGKRRLESFALPQVELRGIGHADGRLVAGGADGWVRLITPHVLLLIDAHAGGATCAAFTPDGAALVSGGADQTLRVWNAADGQPLAQLTGLTDVPTALVLTPDGRQAIAGSADRLVRVWPLRTLPAPAQPLPPQKEIPLNAAVRGMSLSADGTRLAVAGDDQVVRVWSLALDRELQRFSGHAGAVAAVALSADGNTVVSGSVDKTARVSRLALSHIRVAQKPSRDVEFLPDGSRFVTAGEHERLTFWKTTETGLAAAGELPPAEATLEGFVAARQVALAVRPDGAQLAALDESGRVNVWDIAAEKWLFGIAAVADGESPGLEENAPGGELSYAPNGSRLLVGRGKHVRVFDAPDGRLLETFDEPAPVTGVAFGPEGRTLVVARVGQQDNAVLRHVSLERLMAGHRGAIRGLVFTPDGNALLSAGDDRVVRRCNVADGQLQRTYAGPADAITCVRITSDSARVVAGSRDQTVRVWPLNPPAAEGQGASSPQDPVPPQQTWTAPAAVLDVSLSPNNFLAAVSGEDGIVRVHELATGRQWERFRGHTAAVAAAAFAPDNRTLVSGGHDATARMWTMSVVRAVAAHEGAVHELAAVAGGAQVATAGAEGIKHWDVGSGNLIRTLAGNGAAIVSVAVRNDNQQAIASDAEDRILLWNFGNGQLAASFKAPAAVTQVRFAPDNQKFLAACADRRLRFYNPADGMLLNELPSPHPLTAAAFTLDGRKVLTDGDRDVLEWRYASPTALRTLGGHGGSVYGVTYSRDGRWIASTSADQTVRIWDAATGQQTRQLTGHQGPVYAAAFSPDGALLVSCGADKSIRLFDALGGRQLKQIPAGDAALYSVAFYSDGKRVAAAGLDRKVYVYDVFTGERLQALDKHQDYLYRVALNPAGTRLLSCGYGGNIMVWNAADGQQLFAKSVGQVANFADFSPDGTRIVVAGGDGRAHFVDVPATAR